VVAYVRTVTTASGATGVQIAWSSRRGSRSSEHVGSAHDEAELALGLAEVAGSGPLLITSSRMSHPLGALCAVYEMLGVRVNYRGRQGVS
jgi:hypothetical protein